MNVAAKIMNWTQARLACEDWRADGLQIVFTNGCFDILHKGHVQYLVQASALGSKLIVGMNSDDSTRRLKGPGRPINRQDSRAFVLAALSMVDAVVVFDEDTPLELIKTLGPNYLVKGGDYSREQIAGHEFVTANGGEVVVLPYLPGFSTSGIEQKIKDSTNLP